MYAAHTISATSLGQLLIAAGLLGRTTLDAALERQRARNRRLGDLLVEMGVLDSPELNTVLALQDDLRGGRAAEVAGLISGRLGEILMRAAAVTPAQLDSAIAEHERTGILLGEALVAQGAISRAQLDEALLGQHRNPQLRPGRYKLGRMLVEEGALTQAQLNAAISKQAECGERLGAILIRLGTLAPSRLLAALARQRHLISAAATAIRISGSLSGVATRSAMAAAAV